MKKLLQILGGCGGGCKKGFALLLMGAMILSIGPVAYAYIDFEEEGETHSTLDPEDLTEGEVLSTFIELEQPFFFRTNPDLSGDSEDYLEGYGYGYFAGGTYGYGYGFGYGYDFFTDNALGWIIDEEPEKFGYGTGSSYGEYVLYVEENEDGNQEVTTQVEQSFSGSEGSDVEGIGLTVPEGTTLVGPAGWDGSIALTGLDEASDEVGDMDNGITVRVETGGFDIFMDGVAVVVIPYEGFGDIADPIIKVATAAAEGDDAFELALCTDAQYEDGEDKAEPASYMLDAVDVSGDGTYDDVVADIQSYVDQENHCYNISDDGDTVYVATTHFSDFAAGSVASSSSSSSSSGGSVLKKKLLAGENLIPLLYAKKISEFSDLTALGSASWQYPVIQQMLDLGLFKGKMVDGKNVFDMNGNMTRAMAATVICRYMGCDEKTVIVDAPFTDVPKTAWYASPVAYLKANGIVNGKTATTFDPNATVTRAEFFKMVVNAYIALHPSVATEWNALLTGTTTYFDDVTPTSWYAGYMNLGAEKGLMKGYKEGAKTYARGGKNVSRVEAGAMLGYLLNL